MLGFDSCMFGRSVIRWGGDPIAFTNAKCREMSAGGAVVEHAYTRWDSLIRFKRQIGLWYWRYAGGLVSVAQAPSLWFYRCRNGWNMSLGPCSWGFVACYNPNSWRRRDSVALIMKFSAKQTTFALSRSLVDWPYYQ